MPLGVLKALSDPSFAFKLLTNAFLSLLQFAGVSVFRSWWETQPAIVQVFVRNFIKGTDTQLDDDLLAAAESGAQEGEVDVNAEMAAMMGTGS